MTLKEDQSSCCMHLKIINNNVHKNTCGSYFTEENLQKKLRMSLLIFTKYQSPPPQPFTAPHVHRDVVSPCNGHTVTHHIS